MAKYEGQDHYLDPATGVLRNRLGITDAGELEQAEASLVAWRSYELSQQPMVGQFDLAHLQAIHRHLFGDVYDWAGELRTIDLFKGTSYFANHRHLLSAALPLFKKLEQERHLHGLDATAFSHRAAYYLSEMNALHPFREGNGRAQREFIHQLAQTNGYFIDWTTIDRDDLMQASIEAFHRGDTTKLAALIEDHLGYAQHSGPKR